MTPAELFPDPTTAEPTFAVFSDHRLVASGSREVILRAAKKHLDKKGDSILIFDEASGRQIDFNFRGSIDEVLDRARDDVKPGPGRPKLGVVSREISLLPRHWDWLENQPNGASAAIRRLVDDARRNETGIERGRHARNAIGKLLWSLAGNLPNFEEVIRALDGRDDQRLDELMTTWPKDVRAYVRRRVELAVALEGW